MEQEQPTKVETRRREGSAKILTLAEAAEYLHTSYSTVYRLVSDGGLDAFRLRKSWRTSTAACEAYVRQQFAENAMEREQAAIS